MESGENTGARPEGTGAPKTNFSHVKARILTINKILFDTYEEREDVQVYIRPFLCAVEFVSHIQAFGDQVYSSIPKAMQNRVTKSASGFGKDAKESQRIPIYSFIWGTQKKYLRYCTIDGLSYNFRGIALIW